MICDVLATGEGTNLAQDVYSFYFLLQQIQIRRDFKFEGFLFSWLLGIGLTLRTRVILIFTLHSSQYWRVEDEVVQLC